MASENSLDVIAVLHRLSAIKLSSVKCVDGLDVGDHDEDCAREDEDERNDAQKTDGIQAHELDCKLVSLV